MEVHHHASAIGSHTTGKKWVHYFWEFLMLFLAVFCGFLAEYQLEHKIEKDRERQYIQSLVEDLSTDTTSLQLVIENFKRRDLNLDTLLSLYPFLATGYNNTLHRKLVAVSGFADFVKADRTMQQLKNSGGMRLIRNKKAADGITEYDLMSKDLDIDVAALTLVFIQILETRYEIIDSAALANDVAIRTVAEMESGGKNYLLKSDKQSLGKWNNQIREFKFMCRKVMGSEQTLKKKAIELIGLLRNQYHLD